MRLYYTILLVIAAALLATMNAVSAKVLSQVSVLSTVEHPPTATQHDGPKRFLRSVDEDEDDDDDDDNNNDSDEERGLAFARFKMKFKKYTGISKVERAFEKRQLNKWLKADVKPDAIYKMLKLDNGNFYKSPQKMKWFRYKALYNKKHGISNH
ncbi:hypothetical protein PHYBOEH_010484 [Phytophthora boehmeriae]|uniref:RxLR effector protein n=1 Tax=Phytophthora boehmeriae TaxID=109152 RepID=A0A8T1VR15_9STRA|nr:hypothetical protein PHYBOEH_010484 [Phytophthora boehmeriae]